MNSKTLFMSVLVVCTLALGAQAAPSITSIDPVSGTIGTAVTVNGSGFAAAGNVIHFQNAMTSMVYEARITASSANGTQIGFTIPSAVNPVCYYQTPPCASPSLQVSAGAYLVFVDAQGSTSNAKEFTVIDTATPTQDPGSSPPPPDYFLVIHSNVESSNNTVTVNPPGSTVPYPITFEYPSATTVTITANNYVGPSGSALIFTGWSGALTGSANPATLVVGGLVNVTANYAFGDPVPTPVPSPTPYCQGYIIGDVNRNGSVDIVDALTISQIYVGILTTPPFPVCAGDANRNGGFDIVDALLIAQCYVGLISCDF